VLDARLVIGMDNVVFVSIGFKLALEVCVISGMNKAKSVLFYSNPCLRGLNYKQAFVSRFLKSLDITTSDIIVFTIQYVSETNIYCPLA